jgi:hypothetical protein
MNIDSTISWRYFLHFFNLPSHLLLENMQNGISFLTIANKSKYHPYSTYEYSFTIGKSHTSKDQPHNGQKKGDIKTSNGPQNITQNMNDSETII